MPYVRKNDKSQVVLAYEYEVPALQKAGWEVLDNGHQAVTDHTTGLRSDESGTTAAAKEEARKAAGIYDVITTPRDVATSPTTAPVEGGKFPKGGEEAVQGRKNTGGDKPVKPAKNVEASDGGVNNEAADEHNNTVDPNADSNKAK